MLYIDTSFLTPLFLEETTSADVETFIARQPVGSLAISHWTRVEFSSLLAREVRMGGLDADTAKRTDADFEDVMAESFVVLTPDVADFNLAKAYLGRAATGLRAGDALHLAIASRPDVKAIHSFDKGLIRAAGLLGVTVG